MAQRQTNGTNSRRTNPSRSSAKGGKASAAPNKSASWLDDRSKRDIAGVVICVLAVALMIAVVATTSGAATELVARGLRYAIGAGAYILPVMLLLWGLSFFIRIGDISEGRTGIGLATVVVSIISMLAMGSPGVPDRQFFATEELLARGGYLGSAIAWALNKFGGVTIGYVVLAGVLVVGLVITGISISGVVEWLRARWAASRQPAPEPAARGRAPKTTPLADVASGVADAAAGAAAAATEALPGRRRREDAVDPEAARKTAPTPKAVAPRRMEGFELPPFDLLKRTKETAAKHQATDRELRETAAAIAETLATFDIPARVVDWVAGPTVTLFEVEIAKGVRLSKVTALADDLALALAASQIRILAPIPGKSLVGIEVPNVRRSAVTLGDALAPAGEGGPLVLAIGKDVAGAPVLADLATMPHLLLGGTTGSGKSVAINAMLVSILMRSTPSEVRLILIDPKRVELSLYNGVPHLYVPVVTEPREAASALAWSVSEMERRLKLLSSAGARNIGQFNAMIQDGKGPEGALELPYLVIVIDELADLMMVAAKEVEDSICRIAQLARAAGIHLIVATQRPEANVVTGLIKANITNRIAFNVASAIDSRVILDQPGAEKLVGLGDMLFSIPAWPKPKRIQGCYVAEDEIETVVSHLKEQAQPDYHEEILHMKVAAAGGGIDTGEDDDPLLWEAADIVVTSGIGSTSLLQRRLSVGYARAGRIMDMLEAKGVVGPPSGSKPREVLVEIDDLEALKAFERQDAQEEY